MDEQSDRTHSIFPICMQGIYKLTNIRLSVLSCMVRETRKGTNYFWTVESQEEEACVFLLLFLPVHMDFSQNTQTKKNRKN